MDTEIDTLRPDDVAPMAARAAKSPGVKLGRLARMQGPSEPSSGPKSDTQAAGARASPTAAVTDAAAAEAASDRRGGDAAQGMDVDAAHSAAPGAGEGAHPGRPQPVAQQVLPGSADYAALDRLLEDTQDFVLPDVLPATEDAAAPPTAAAATAAAAAEAAAAEQPAAISGMADAHDQQQQQHAAGADRGAAAAAAAPAADSAGDSGPVVQRRRKKLAATHSDAEGDSDSSGLVIKRRRRSGPAAAAAAAEQEEEEGVSDSLGGNTPPSGGPTMVSDAAELEAMEADDEAGASARDVQLGRLKRGLQRGGRGRSGAQQLQQSGSRSQQEGMDEEDAEAKGRYQDEEDELEDYFRAKSAGEEDSEDGAESDEQASGCSGGAAAKGRRAGSEGPQEEDLLATNADKLNADTQRIMREMASKDVIGKGFEPVLAPVSSLLDKLNARKEKLMERAKQLKPPPPPAPISFEQLKARLDQTHAAGAGGNSAQVEEAAAAPGPSLRERLGAREAAAAAAAAGQEEAAAELPADNNGQQDDQQPAEDADEDMEADLSDDGDDLLIVDEPSTEAAAGQKAALHSLLTDTQDLMAPVPLDAREATPSWDGVSDDEDEEEELELDISNNSSSEAGGSEEEDAAQSQGSGGSDQREEGSDGPASQGVQASDGSPHDGDDAGDDSPPTSQEREEEAGADAFAKLAAGAAAAQRPAAAGVRGLRQQLRQGGLFDMEAEMSDSEGAVHDDDEDMEAEGQDGILLDLIGTAKETHKDEVARHDLHKRWLEEQDAKDVRQMMHAIQHGFTRNRGNQFDEEDDGTDAAARRRRALLLGTLDEEDEGAIVNKDSGRLDFEWHEEEQDAAAQSAAELAARHWQQRRKASSSLQDANPALLPASLDEESQEVLALLSRSQSVTTGAGQLPRVGSEPGGGAAAAAGGGRAAGLPTRAGGAAAGPAGADTDAGAFRFTMFGRDVTNNGQAGPAGAGKAAEAPPGSFLARASSAPAAAAIRTASNFGCSKSFVFGVGDGSNHSNPAAEAQEGAGPGPSRLKSTTAGSAAGDGQAASFAGLKGMIGDSQKAQAQHARAAAGRKAGAGAGRLFSLLNGKAGGEQRTGEGVDLHALHSTTVRSKRGG